VPDPARPHDVSTLTPRELEQARRELAASLALARPGSPIAVPITARLTAIDTELAARTPRHQPGGSPPPATILLCSCGFGTSDRHWLEGHLFQHPGHHQRPQRWTGQAGGTPPP
jgi:hypothetical protein